ncbi:alpha/beta hydrolase [Nocardia fusca]|uniref:alpha/beta hydrolase n=1 Tax=Nocardia fusca TaxID=941183 RepID=UPI00379CA933
MRAIPTGLVGLLTVVTAVGTRRYVAFRPALKDLAPEFRSLWLLLVPHTVTPRTLGMRRLAMQLPTPAGRGVQVSRRVVGGANGMTVEVISPTPASDVLRPALLYIHGGGFIEGSPQSERRMAADLARGVDAVVVSPNYRLAPENPFPAGLDDCMAALRYMRAHAAGLGIDADRIAVMGASAGGGLAGSVAQRCYDEGIPLRAQALKYPMIDDRTTLRDCGRRGRFIWTPAANALGWSAYLGRPPRMEDAPEYAAPARRQDLTGLPPAWVGVGDLDLFFEEDVDYARRLTVADVDCEVVTVAGMYHGGEHFAGRSSVAQALRNSLIAFLRSHLTK